MSAGTCAHDGILRTMAAVQRDRQQVKQRIVESVRAGDSAGAAARAASISERTVSRWRSADQVFDQLIKVAFAFSQMTPEEAILRLENLAQRADQAGKTDVDYSDMDGPTR